MDGSADTPPRDRILQAARGLFDQRGFHSTPVADLAAEAKVSVGQIYRFFPGKDDIIVAIVEADVDGRLREMEQVFAQVRAGRSTAFEAVQAIARLSLLRQMALSFEMLAEAYRNERVAAQLQVLAERYRARIRELALLVRPDAADPELEAYEDILTACFFGLGHRTLIAPNLDIERASHQTACLLMQALSEPGRETVGR
jgi:TetR/AcrR family transcriptional regulator, repressor for uid operon